MWNSYLELKNEIVYVALWFYGLPVYENMKKEREIRIVLVFLGQAVRFFFFNYFPLKK